MVQLEVFGTFYPLPAALGCFYFCWYKRVSTPQAKMRRAWRGNPLWYIVPWSQRELEFNQGHFHVTAIHEIERSESGVQISSECRMQTLILINIICHRHVQIILSIYPHFSGHWNCHWATVRPPSKLNPPKQITSLLASKMYTWESTRRFSKDR